MEINFKIFRCHVKTLILTIFLLVGYIPPSIFAQILIERILLKGSIGQTVNTQNKVLPTHIDNAGLVDEDTRTYLYSLFYEFYNPPYWSLIERTTLIFQSDEIQVAQVGLQSEHQCLIVSPELRNKIAKNDWEIKVILAHELGHLVARHMMSGDITKEDELTADEFAGFFCKSMGCKSVRMILPVFKQFTEDETHYSYKIRAKAIKRGWKDAEVRIKRTRKRKS